MRLTTWRVSFSYPKDPSNKKVGSWVKVGAYFDSGSEFELIVYESKALNKQKQKKNGTKQDCFAYKVDRCDLNNQTYYHVISPVIHPCEIGVVPVNECHCCAGGGLLCDRLQRTFMNN